MFHASFASVSSETFSHGRLFRSLRKISLLYFEKFLLSIVLRGANEGGVGGCHTPPPIISTPGPSCNLMGRSRSRSGPVCIKFLFITPLAYSSSVGAVTCYSKAALAYFLGRTDIISGY